MSCVSAELSEATASSDSVARLGSSADAITAPAVTEDVGAYMTTAAMLEREHAKGPGIGRQRHPQCNWTGFPARVMFARPVQFTEDGRASEARHDRFREVLCVRSVR